MTNPDRVYWDSCTYLDYLTGEHELHDMMQLVIDDWRNGLVTMVTSALTIAEVYYVRMADGRIDRSKDRDIDTLFEPPPEARLILVELNRITAYQARDLARAAIGAKDAVHVASAREARCPVMHTNEKTLWDKSGKVGGNPLLRIEAPAWTRQLAMEAQPDRGTFTPLIDPNVPVPPSERSRDDAQG